jgi:hypothetical protein
MKVNDRLLPRNLFIRMIVAVVILQFRVRRHRLRGFYATIAATHNPVPRIQSRDNIAGLFITANPTVVVASVSQ